MPDPKSSDTKRGRGRPPKFDNAALLVIKQVVSDHPTASMTELVGLVEAATGIRSSRKTLRNALKELGVENVSRPGPKPKRPVMPSEATSGVDDEGSDYGYAPQHREADPSVQHTLGVSGTEWELVRDIFEATVRGNPRKHSRRDMLDGMLYVLRGGSSWRALPSEFPPWQQVYATYRRWVRQGLFRLAMRRLRRGWRERVGREHEPTGAVIDSQSVATSAQGGR